MKALSVRGDYIMDMVEGNLLFGKTKTFHWDGKRLYLVVKVYMRA